MPKKKKSSGPPPRKPTVTFHAGKTGVQTLDALAARLQQMVQEGQTKLSPYIRVTRSLAIRLAVEELLLRLRNGDELLSLL